MAICLTVQFVVRPGIVCGICLLFGLTDKLAIGFMLCSMAPGGNGSNLLELIFRGNVELGIVCTLFSSVVAAIAIPVDFYVYARRFSEDSFTFASMPWVDMMLAIICVFTGAVAGAVVRYRDDERGAWLEKRAAGLGLLLLVAAVAIAVATNARALAMIPGNAWLAAVFPCPIALGCGYVPSRLAGLGQVEARTVAIEIAEANIGVAYAILLLMYDDEDDRTKVFAGLVAYTIFNEVYIFSVAAYWRCAAPIERPPRDTSFRKKTLDASTGDPEDLETGGLDLAAAPADGGDIAAFEVREFEVSGT